MEFYSTSKKKEVLSLVTTTWMKPEDIMLSEIGQPRENKSFVVSLIGRLQSNPTQKQSGVVVDRSWVWGEQGDDFGRVRDFK